MSDNRHNEAGRTSCYIAATLWSYNLEIRFCYPGCYSYPFSYSFVSWLKYQKIQVALPVCLSKAHCVVVFSSGKLLEYAITFAFSLN